jgi:hypothetical protein
VVSAGVTAMAGWLCRPLFPPLALGLTLDLVFMAVVYAAGMFLMDRSNVLMLVRAAWERFGSR